MVHLLSCRLLDEACTADDLATVTEWAMACARKWGGECVKDTKEEEQSGIAVRRGQLGLHQGRLWYGCVPQSFQYPGIGLGMPVKSSVELVVTPLEAAQFNVTRFKSRDVGRSRITCHGVSTT